MTLPPSGRASFSFIPNDAASLLVEPTAAFVSTKQQSETASAEHANVKGHWRTRLFLAQCAIAFVLFVRWTGQHSVIGAAVMAFLAFLPLGVLPLLAGVFSGSARQRMEAAHQRLATERQAEVERNLAGMQCGQYQWIRRGDEYLAVFPETHFLYHFGTASNDRHLLLDARRAVQLVRVTTNTHVQQTSTGTTTHGRRLVVAPTPNFAVVGKGRSTTTMTTETSVTNTHTLEVQVQLSPGAQPGWILLPFGADGHEAENWRLLVSQLR